MMKKVTFTVFLGALISLGLFRYGFSEPPFYEGKTIRVVTGSGPEGTGALRTRVFVSVLKKHIPGNPTLLVEYMDGGGGRKAANYMYKAARPDGLTMGIMSSGFAPAAVLDDVGVLYDLQKMIYLGSAYSGAPYVFLTRKELGLNTPEKLANAAAVRIGSRAVGHSIYYTGRAFAYLFGMKEPKFITGYGGTDLDLAIMQGEVDARAIVPDTIPRRNPEWIEKALMDFHAIIEVPKGRRHSHPFFARLPDLETFARSERERKLLALHRAFQGIALAVVLPPGTPKDRVQILREAVRKTLNGPDYSREYKKLLRDEPKPLMHEETEEAIRQLPRDPEVLDLFKKLSGPDPLPSR
jgi:tripartite-type tricarboxylate transporter receptor subunit TctC